MKRLAPLLTLAVLTGCRDTRTTVLTPELEAVVDSNTEFAVDLYQRIAGSHDNLIVSPMSISAALSMTLVGAAGETEEEIAAVLRVDPDEADAYHAEFGALLQDLNGNFGGYQLNAANRLYGAEGFDWHDDFLDVNKDAYDAPLQELDFSDAVDASDEINRWVSRQTGGMIDELVSPGYLDSSTAMVLVNALYFNGDWARPFEESATTSQPFTTLDNNERTVQMMSATISMGYAEDDTVQVGQLPYEGHEMSLFVVLPLEEDGLESVEKALSNQVIETWDAALAEQSVRLELPRIAIESDLDLTEPLKDMGMPSAFDPVRADFSNMADDAIHLSFAVHDAIVEVEETGTEAAAATAFGYTVSSAPSEPVSLTADHPFLFFIRDDLSGAILFAGRVTNP